MFPHLTTYERENMRTFYAHPKARNYPADPRGIFGVLESRYDHYRHCQLPYRDGILAEIEGQARQVLRQWRHKRFGG
jgi:hypothetical protein